MGVIFKHIPKVIFKHRALYNPVLLLGTSFWSFPTTRGGSFSNTKPKSAGHFRTQAYFLTARTVKGILWGLIGGDWGLGFRVGTGVGEGFQSDKTTL